MEDHKKALFQKFIHDACSPEEIEQLLHYLQNSKDEAPYQDLMDEVWAKLKAYPPVGKTEKEQQFERMIKRINGKKNNTPKIRLLFGKYSWQMAATFSLLLLVGSLLYLQFIHTTAVTHQTGFGETRNIALPDGSEVLLNNNSVIRYAEHWDAGETREVFLEGEAYFSVVPTRDKKQFVVKTTDEVSVEVLGTRFNVQNRHNITEVVLNEGKVKVNFEKQEVLMEPGELLSYSQTTHQYHKKLIDAKTYTSWKDSMLIFENHPLLEIALSLEDNYGYTIHFSDKKIGKYRFTGTIPTDKVNALFTMLTKSFDLKIEKEGKEIWIKHNP